MEDNKYIVINILVIPSLYCFQKALIKLWTQVKSFNKTLESKGFENFIYPTELVLALEMSFCESLEANKVWRAPTLEE